MRIQPSPPPESPANPTPAATPPPPPQPPIRQLRQTKQPSRRIRTILRQPIIIRPHQRQLKLRIPTTHNAQIQRRIREQHLRVNPIQILLPQTKLRPPTTGMHLLPAHPRPTLTAHTPNPALVARRIGIGFATPSTTQPSPRSNDSTRAPIPKPRRHPTRPQIPRLVHMRIRRHQPIPLRSPPRHRQPLQRPNHITNTHTHASQPSTRNPNPGTQPQRTKPSHPTSPHAPGTETATPAPGPRRPAHAGPLLQGQARSSGQARRLGEVSTWGHCRQYTAIVGAAPSAAGCAARRGSMLVTCEFLC